MTTRNRFMIFLSLMFLMVLSVGTGAMFYVLFWEKAYLSYTNIPFESDHQELHPGDLVGLNVGRCNRDKIAHSYLVTNSLYEVNTKLFTLLPSVQLMVVPGCTTAISRINTLPKALPPGQYKLFGTAEAHGTIRTFILDWQSETFNVKGSYE